MFVKEHEKGNLTTFVMEHKRGNLTTTGFGKVLFGRAVKKRKKKSLYIYPSIYLERERERSMEMR